jgi:hypothetical protein
MSPVSYTVSLTVTGPSGCDNSTRVDYVVVNPPSYALSDIPVRGTVSGDFTNTHSSDDIYETITEVSTGGKPSRRYSLLEQKWDFNVAAGATAVFSVEAYRPDNPDNDDFTFEYSTDNSSFTPLLTVHSAVEQVYQAPFPTNVSGTVYVRVVDTDKTRENLSYDQIYVDHMYIESDCTPASSDTMLVSDVTVARGLNKGNKGRGEAAVNVIDQNNLPVVGALVEGQFSGPSDDIQSGTTGSDGSAVIQSEKVRDPLGSWCFTVNDITLGSNIYDPTRNVETTDCEAAAKMNTGRPSGYVFSQNYPNPFNPVTQISFILPEDDMVRLEVYNLIGQKLSTMINGFLEAGDYFYRWDGSEFPTGIYFYRLEIGEQVEIRKMLLLK